jgi:hypothetical protein
VFGAAGGGPLVFRTWFQVKRAVRGEPPPRWVFQLAEMEGFLGGPMGRGGADVG